MKDQKKKLGRPFQGKEDSRILSIRVPLSKYEHYRKVFYTLVKTDVVLNVTK